MFFLACRWFVLLIFDSAFLPAARNACVHTDMMRICGRSCSRRRRRSLGINASTATTPRPNGTKGYRRRPPNPSLIQASTGTLNATIWYVAFDSEICGEQRGGGFWVASVCYREYGVGRPANPRFSWVFTAGPGIRRAAGNSMLRPYASSELFHRIEDATTALHLSYHQRELPRKVRGIPSPSSQYDTPPTNI